MNLRKVCLPLGLAITLSPGLALRADVAPVTPVPSAAQTLSAQEVQEMDAKVRELHELFNRLELQAEQTKSQIDKAKPQPISFGQGTLLMANSMAWPNFDSRSGAQLNLGLNLSPIQDVKGQVELEFLAANALDRLLPQQENTMELTKQWAIVRKAEVRFENDSVLTRAFRAIPRTEWYEEGDMFYLFPAADDTNKYFRQSGRAVPSGMQILAKDGWLKGAEVWAGDELVYGGKSMAVARYKTHLGPVDAALLGQWISDPKYFSGKNMEINQEAWVRFPLFSGFNMDLAGLHKPTKVGQTYTVTSVTSAGQGISGTAYLPELKTTTDGDSWGGLVRIHGLNTIPVFDEVQLIGEYTGPLAGNRLRTNGLLSARPFRYLLFSVEGTWQKPIVGVNPAQVIVGTPSLLFSTIPGTGPRPYGSAVTVSQDPISGQNNREMTEMVVTIEFNPGQGWFYKYRPRVVDTWNFNQDLKTSFSNAISARMFNYPTGTDLGSYIDVSGNAVGEAATASGQAPSNGWLYEVKDITAFGIGGIQSWLAVATGQQTSGLSPNSSVVPANTYFSSELGSKFGNTTLSGGYAEDVYGPDDWYHTFGIVIGNRYKARAAYAFGKSELAISYEGWRDKDPTKYHNPVNTVNTVSGPILVEPTIDQVMTSYTLNF